MTWGTALIFALPSTSLPHPGPPRPTPGPHSGPPRVTRPSGGWPEGQGWAGWGRRAYGRTAPGLRANSPVEVLLVTAGERDFLDILVRLLRVYELFVPTVDTDVPVAEELQDVSGLEVGFRHRWQASLLLAGARDRHAGGCPGGLRQAGAVEPLHAGSGCATQLV